VLRWMNRKPAQHVATGRHLRVVEPDPMPKMHAGMVGLREAAALKRTNAPAGAAHVHHYEWLELDTYFYAWVCKCGEVLDT
jgi:hypothetical protein